MYCYEIGPCPRCGSQLTGRLKMGKEGKSSFMFGNPVIYASDPEQYTCACANCGVRWVGTGKMVRRSRAEVKKLKAEWQKNEEKHPGYTKEEEAAIADDLYYGLQEEGLVQEEEFEKKSFVRRVIGGWARQTGQQGRSLIDDFYGLTGRNYHDLEDKDTDQDEPRDGREE